MGCKVKRKHVVVLICCGIMMLICWYVPFVYMRTPEYIHAHRTPAYEQEAEKYFLENHERLTQLTELADKIPSGLWYRYTFGVHTFDSTELPDDIRKALKSLEERTDKSYTVVMSNEYAEILIVSATFFEVYLYHGNDRLHGLKQEWDKAKILEDGWEIHAPYIVRG